MGPKSGKFLETLGSYNPKTKERILSTERIQHWLSKGAKASGTMHNMLISANVISGKKVNVLPKKTPPKKEEPAVEASAPVQQETVSAPEEAPVQEVQATEESTS